jgi:hypothetical protein
MGIAGHGRRCEPDASGPPPQPSPQAGEGRVAASFERCRNAGVAER